MLQTGDLVPHFTVTTFSGESFDYSDIWQRKNLVLVLLPNAESAASTNFVDQLTARMSEVTGDDTHASSRETASQASPAQASSLRIDGERFITSPMEKPSTIYPVLRPDRMASLRAASVSRVRRRVEVRRHALNSDRTPSSFHIEPRRFIVKRRRNAKIAAALPISHYRTISSKGHVETREWSSVCLYRSRVGAVRQRNGPSHLSAFELMGGGQAKRQ